MDTEVPDSDWDKGVPQSGPYGVRFDSRLEFLLETTNHTKNEKISRVSKISTIPVFY